MKITLLSLTAALASAVAADEWGFGIGYICSTQGGSSMGKVACGDYSGPGGVHNPRYLVICKGIWEIEYDCGVGGYCSMKSGQAQCYYS